MRFSASRLLVAVLVTLLPNSLKGQILFQEVAESMGIHHAHETLTQLGGGVAVFDYDNDGYQDIYLVGGQMPDKLLRNVNGASFEDVSLAAGIVSATGEPSTFGVVTGDVDNDGYRDILVTTEFGHESILFRNLGNGTFQHLPNAFNDGLGWKTAAAFGDVNNDGLLDIYITSYVFQSYFELDKEGNVTGFSHDCDPNLLFINNGDLTFTDATDLYGVGDEGCALAVVFTDFDQDNDVDISIANDFGSWVLPNALLQNDYPNTQFDDVAATQSLDHGIYAMGIAVGDYDKDGDLDYYQTNLGRNVLSRNDNGVFTDVTTLANCENDSAGQLLKTGWGTFFFDADNDSWPDLFVANGWLLAADIIETLPEDPNGLYQNNGDGTFTDVSNQSGVNSVRRARGAACGDFNNDGLLDVVINNSHDYPDSTHWELYHNVAQNSNNWVGFQLLGTVSNRDAYGSSVRLVVDGETTLAELNGGSSHASQNSSIIHFGLGESTTVDSAIVKFPSGIERVLTQIEANQVVEVVEDVAIKVQEATAQFEASINYINGQPVLNVGSFESAFLTIYDASGRTLTFKKLETGQTQWLLSELVDMPSGIYYASIQWPSELQTLKFVIVD